jgi:hypothetical protein
MERQMLSPQTTAPAATTIAERDIPEIGSTEAAGTALGGHYAGRINADGKHYALIVSPVAGALQGRWNTVSRSVAGATSLTDGLANTQAMAAAGSRIAAAALALDIEGFTDWYIPARDELELLYRHFKPTDRPNYACYDGANEHSMPPGGEYSKDSPTIATVAGFAHGGPDAIEATWQWSSTQHAADPSSAWSQYFSDGFQYGFHKSYEGRARAVRRLEIQSFDNSNDEQPVAVTASL